MSHQQSLQWLESATSPRVVQAFLVGVFSIVVAIMALTDRSVPDIIAYSLASIIGYYFADAQTTSNFPRPTPPAAVAQARQPRIIHAHDPGGIVTNSTIIDPVDPDTLPFVGEGTDTATQFDPSTREGRTDDR